jgi:hypothetical protein
MKTDICRAPGCDRIKDKKQASRLCVTHRVRWSRYKSFDLPPKLSLPIGIYYICDLHGELLEIQCYKNPKDGYYSCKECRKNTNINFQLSNPNRTRTRNFYFIGKTKLKIKMSEYEELRKKQNDLCSICNQPETMKPGRNARWLTEQKLTKNLALDHCHESAAKGILKIRGLLCHHCNTGIGHFKDSPELLKAAIDYLKKATD